MTWFKVDDKLHSHPKWWATSPNAKALWVTAGAWCGSYNTNGLVRTAELSVLAPQVGLTLGKVRAAADELVSADLWHLSDDPAGFVFHHWTDFQLTKAKAQQIAAIEKERKKIQNDPDLKAAVRLRDLDLCRYCGEQVNFAARTGNLAGRYDHIIPVTKGGLTVIPNVVVACNACNGEKYNKTVDQVGFTLLDPGTSARELEDRLGKCSVFARSRAEQRHGSGSGPGRDGVGGVGAGVTPMSDLLRDVFPGSVEVGSTGGQ